MPKFDRSESEIQSMIMHYLQQLPNAFIFKIHTGGMYGSKGIPDIHMTMDGKSYFFEVKRPGNKATPLQLAKIERIRKAGGVAEVVCSVDDVEEIIRLKST